MSDSEMYIVLGCIGLFGMVLMLIDARETYSFERKKGE